MAKVDLIDNNWVDLVFEGKNQAYGAYQLRKNTGVRNVKALLWVIAAIAAIFLLVWAKVAIENAMPKQTVNTADIELSKLAQKKEAKVERKEPVKVEMEKVVEKVKSSVKFTAPEIKKDDEVQPEDEIKSQDDLSKTNTAIGTFDVKGNDEAEGEVLKAKEVVVDEKPKEEETKVFDVVEQMPSFPGGDAELMKFLSTHIKYPVVAEENGIQGRVIATFVVERDGSISDVKVVKSVDRSLYKVPVTFRLQ